MEDKTACDNDFFCPGSVSSVIWLCQSCQFELPIILNIFGWDISDSPCFLAARKNYLFLVAHHFLHFLIMQLLEGLCFQKTRAFRSCCKTDMLKLRLLKSMFEKWYLKAILEAVRHWLREGPRTLNWIFLCVVQLHFNSTSLPVVRGPILSMVTIRTRKASYMYM